MVFLAEVSAAGLLTVEGIYSHQATNLDEVCQTECFLQLVVERTCLARDIYVAPELFLDGIDFLDSRLEALCGTSHADEVPHDETQLLVDGVHRAFALDSHEAVDLVLHVLLRRSKLRQVGGHTRYADLVGEVVLDGVRQYEVAVSKTLHECGSTEAVGTVVGEVRLADAEETFDGGLQFVVHPDTTHGIVDSREDHHRVLIGVLVHDFLVHLEEVAVFLRNDIFAEALDSVGEVEEDSETCVVHAEAFVATLFGSTRSHVAGHEVTEGRIAALQVVVAVFLGDIASFDFTAL